MTALEAAMATLSASSKTDTASTSKPQPKPSKRRKTKIEKLPVPPPKSNESVLDKPTSTLVNTMIDQLNDDGLDLPESLKVENRVPLTPEQQAKLDAAKAATEDKQNTLREQIKAAKAEKSRGRVAKMLAKKSGAAAAMPLTGKAALDAIKRVPLVSLKPENGDSKIVAEAIQNGKTVHKVPAGKTYEQVMEAERNARRAAQAADNKPQSRITRSAIPNSARQIAQEDFAQRKRKPATSGKSKTDIAREMLSRKDGATRKEIAAATNWPSINLKPIADRAGKKLVVDKDGRCRMT